MVVSRAQINDQSLSSESEDWLMATRLQIEGSEFRCVHPDYLPSDVISCYRPDELWQIQLHRTENGAHP
jgi:hypothetical protein